MSVMRSCELIDSDECSDVVAPPSPPSEADIRLALAYLDLDAYADTDLGLERPRLEAGEPFLVTALAGLQFYDYGGEDELHQKPIIPELGDRLNLMRRPDNPADPRAIEVWWKNEHMFGHIPRYLAVDLAPILDRGEPLRAYVLRPGSGQAWGLKAILVSRAIETAAYTWFTAEFRREVEVRIEVEADRIWGSRSASKEKRQSAEAWTARRRAARDRRRLEAAEAFVQPPEQAPLPPEMLADPDPALRGKTFTRWPNVPAWLKTKSQLAQLGRRVPPGTRPFARKTGGYGAYDLYVVAETVPKRPPSPRSLARRAIEAGPELEFDDIPF